MNVTSALGWILGSQAPSGAIDVVAIRKLDGSVSCSPFHVKFPVGRSAMTDKLVKLKVNGKDIKLSMKLGSAGEAFFVERTKRHEFVIRRLRSSPPPSTAATQKGCGGIEILSEGKTVITTAQPAVAPSVVKPAKPVSPFPSKPILRRIRSTSDLQFPHFACHAAPACSVTQISQAMSSPMNPPSTQDDSNPQEPCTSATPNAHLESNTSVHHHSFPAASSSACADGAASSGEAVTKDDDNRLTVIDSDLILHRPSRQRSHTIAEGVSYDISGPGDGIESVPTGGQAKVIERSLRPARRPIVSSLSSGLEGGDATSLGLLTAENLHRLNYLQVGDVDVDTTVPSVLSLPELEPRDRNNGSVNGLLAQSFDKSHRKDRPSSGDFTDTVAVPASSSAAPAAKSSSEGWTWTWGDLPIKSTDPSLADLKSLTDIALQEIRRRGGLTESMSESRQLAGEDTGTIDASGEALCTSHGNLQKRNDKAFLDDVSDGKSYHTTHNDSREKIPLCQETTLSPRFKEYREDDGISSQRSCDAPETSFSCEFGTNGSTKHSCGDKGMIPRQGGKTTIHAPVNSGPRSVHDDVFKCVDTLVMSVDSPHYGIDDGRNSDGNDLPDPKHTTPPRGGCDFRQHPTSPTATARELDRGCLAASQDQSVRSLSHSLSFRNRASKVAAALGSDRTLSLCAHILNSTGSDVPQSADELRRVLSQYQVSPEEFTSAPFEVLNNPNLVVVTNDVLIPWHLVHAYLVTKSKLHHHHHHHHQQLPESEGVSSQDIPSSVSGRDTDSNGAEYSSLLKWAGMDISAWDNYITSTLHMSDTGSSTGGRSATTTPHNICSSEIHTASEQHVVADRSVTAALGAEYVTDTVPKSRRGSYGSTGSNEEQCDFDLMECFSEMSTSTGPAGHDGCDGEVFASFSMHVGGIGLWSKEALDWNSVDDFQRLLNECTSHDSVPDILKPYVTGVYSSTSDDEVDVEEELDASTSSAATGQGKGRLTDGPSHVDIDSGGSISTGTMKKSCEEIERDPSFSPYRIGHGKREYFQSHGMVPLSSAETSGSISSSSLPTIVSGLAVSMSHHTGLDRIMRAQSSSPRVASAVTVPIASDLKQSENSPMEVSVQGDNAESVSPHVISLPLNSKSKVPPQDGIDDDKEENDEVSGEDFLSLHDISHDDILPGPARGDVYDGSDTDSFYSLSLDDGDVGPLDTSATGSGGGTAGAVGRGGAKEDTKRLLHRKYLYRKTLVPTQEQIQAMELLDGQNEIMFEVEGTRLTANIFVWPDDAKVVVADIEEAIFVSGGSSGGSGPLALVMSLWGSTSARRETHEGLAQLFNSIAHNGYHFLYIATKPDASQKEKLLKSKSSAGGSDQGLPAGPVFLPPDALIQAFGMARPDLFKAAALRGVRSLFPAQNNPYHAAFGAHARDVIAFSRCDIPVGRTFLVNEKGEITTMSTINTTRSFNEIMALLHQIFPAVLDNFARKKSTFASSSAKSITEDSYNDFNFWRNPIPSPPPLPPTSTCDTVKKKS